MVLEQVASLICPRVIFYFFAPTLLSRFRLRGYLFKIYLWLYEAGCNVYIHLINEVCRQVVMNKRLEKSE